MGIGGLRFQLELALFRGIEVAAPPVSPQPSSAELTRANVPTGTTPPRRRDAPAAAASPATPPDLPRPTAPAPATPPTLTTVTPAAIPTSTEPPPVSGDAATPTAPSKPLPRPTPAAAPSPANPDLDRLAGGWPEIVASVGPATRAVITECRPLSVDGNVVTLGFPETKAFLKDVAARKARELDTAIGTFLGRAVNVRCVATNIELPPTPAPATDAALVLAEARRIFADDIVEIGEVS
jgi:hypothetical protein